MAKIKSNIGKLLLSYQFLPFPTKQTGCKTSKYFVGGVRLEPGARVVVDSLLQAARRFGFFLHSLEVPFSSCFHLFGECFWFMCLVMVVALPRRLDVDLFSGAACVFAV
ncbi:hypothetical protein Dimus_033983 [Dionaea muscipula]